MSQTEYYITGEASMTYSSNSNFCFVQYGCFFKLKKESPPVSYKDLWALS